MVEVLMGKWTDLMVCLRGTQKGSSDMEPLVFVSRRGARGVYSCCPLILEIIYVPLSSNRLIGHYDTVESL